MTNKPQVSLVGVGQVRGYLFCLQDAHITHIESVSYIHFSKQVLGNGISFFSLFYISSSFTNLVLFYSIYLDLECVLHNGCSNISSPIRHTGLLIELKEHELNGETTREF